jgi:PAS domain S-box-containing protein
MSDFKLPKYLEEYKASDYIIQLRAKFIFRLCFALLCAIVLMISFKIVSYQSGIINNREYLSILFPLLGIFLIIFFCLLLLILGYYKISANIMPLSIILLVWQRMFFIENEPFIRSDNIVYILAVLSMLPLLVGNRKIITLYFTVNFLILCAFVIFLYAQNHLNKTEIYDYLIDVSISLVFLGIVGYNIYSINSRALERVENDIAKREEAERALRQSEKKYREMTDLLPQIVYESDMEGNITYINRAGLACFECTEEDIKQGENLFSFIVEKEFAKDNISRIHNGIRIGNQYTAIKKNGEKFPVRVYSSYIEEEGKPVGLRGVISDISDWKNAEEALRASEKKFREMALLLPQVVYESDLNANLTYINQAGTAMFGYTDEDISRGMSVIDAIVKEEQPRLIKTIQSILKGEKTQGNPYTARRKDGSTFPVQIYSSVILGDEGPVGFRGIVYDVSDLMKAEEEIRQSQKLFKTLVEATPVSVSLTDMEGRYILANKKFLDFVALPLERVLSKTSKEIGLQFDEEDYENFRKQLLNKGHIDNIEATIFDRNDNRVDMFLSASVIQLNDQIAILQSTIDITETKEHERELDLYRKHLEIMVKERTEEVALANNELHLVIEKLNATNKQLMNQKKLLVENNNQLKKLIATKDRFFSIIAHDLKNPISALMGFSSLLVQNFDKYNEEKKMKFTRLIEGTSIHTYELLLNLLQWSRSQSGDLIYQPISIAPVVLIDEIISSLEEMLISKELKTSISLETEVEITVDKNMLLTILRNITINAIKYSPRGGEIKFVVKPYDTDQIAILIIDQGIGMNQQLIHDLFKIERKVQSMPGTEEEKGTGLGLIVCKEFIDLNKGQIIVESKPGKGSTFKIIVPETKTRL